MGDKDSLASVESAVVLADLIMVLLKYTLALMKKSHRFDGPIKRLTVAINLWQRNIAWRLLHEGNGNIAVLEEILGADMK